jgi:hypothetical protein
MDLRSQKAADTAFLHLRSGEDVLLYKLGEDGKPDKSKPVGITLYGPGTKQHQKASAEKHLRTIERMRRKGGKLKQTAAEMREDDAEFLTAVTASFHNIERDELQGEALYRATYEDLEIGFIAEQANAFVGDWANFPQGSTKPSPSTSAS